MKIQNIELHNYRSFLFVGKIFRGIETLLLFCASTNKQNIQIQWVTITKFIK